MRNFKIIGYSFSPIVRRPTQRLIDIVKWNSLIGNDTTHSNYWKGPTSYISPSELKVLLNWNVPVTISTAIFWCFRKVVAINSCKCLKWTNIIYVIRLCRFIYFFPPATPTSNLKSNHHQPSPTPAWQTSTKFPTLGGFPSPMICSRVLEVY